MMRRIMMAILVAGIITGLSSCGSSSGGGGGGGYVGIPPLVTVLTPALGAMIKGGAVVQVTWTADDDAALPSDAISIDYGVSGSYTSIAAGLGNSGSYAWTVPGLNSIHVTIRVSVRDADGNVVRGISDSFTVDSTAPIVTAVAPSVNASLNYGDTVLVNWTATDLNLGSDYITLEYNNNGGTDSWQLIAPGLENGAGYSWITPGGLTNAHIRITAVDAAGNAGAAVAAGHITTTADATHPLVLSMSYGVAGSSAGLSDLDAAVNVGLAEYFTIVFDKAMDTSATAGAVSLTPAAGTLSCHWLTDVHANDTLIVAPSIRLADKTAYTLAISAAALDTSANTLDLTGNSAAFSTADADTVPPVLVSAQTNEGTDIVDGAGGDLLANGTDGVIRLVFTFDDTLSTTNGNFRIENTFNEIASYDWGDAEMTIAGTTVTIQLNLDEDGTLEEPGEDALPPGRGYTINLSGIKDTDGNAAEDLEFDVVVEGNGSGTEAPYLLSTIPSDAQTNVRTGRPINIVFSEPLDYATVTAANITVSGSVSGALTIAEFDPMGGSMIGMRIQDGLPAGELITVMIGTGIRDADGTAEAGETFSFTTASAADTAAPALYACSVADGAADIYEMPELVINMSEEILKDTVTADTVFIREKRSGVKLRCFDLEVNGDSGGEQIALRFNGRSAGLAFDGEYVLVINGVEDLSANAANTEVDFTVQSSGGNSAPTLSGIGAELQVLPPAFFGLPGTALQQMISLELYAEDNDSDTLTVTASDGTNDWTLTDGGGGYWRYNGRDESIAAGPGVITFTIDDVNGHTITFRNTFFMPGVYPAHVSPGNGTTITQPADVTLTWTTPAYNDSFTALSLSPDPAGMMGGGVNGLPPIFLNGADTSVTIPADYQLPTGWYFWGILEAVFGYDTTTMVLKTAPGDDSLFIYADPALPTISGTVSQAGGTASGPILILLWDGVPDESMPLGVAVISAPGAYIMSNIMAGPGTYNMTAFRDANGDLDINDGEGSTLVPVIVNYTGTSMTSQNITLEDTILGSISGTITHSPVGGGIESGTVMVVLQDDATSDTVAILLLDDVGTYTFPDLADGDYNVFAFRDANGNMSPESGEGIGSFIGGVITITGNDQIGIDIMLIEIP